MTERKTRHEAGPIANINFRMQMRMKLTGSPSEVCVLVHTSPPVELRKGPRLPFLISADQAQRKAARASVDNEARPMDLDLEAEKAGLDKQ
jgi:hypothetical protein